MHCDSGSHLLRARRYLRLHAPSTACRAALAQRPGNDPRLDEQRAAMGKLQTMVGTWAGAGWILTGPGQRAEFTQTETVQMVLDGTLLTIEGEGRDKNDRARIVHSAFAVLAYDAAKQQYKYVAFSGGRYLDIVSRSRRPWLALELRHAGREDPLHAGFYGWPWHESGEISRDSGQTWSKNFEMTLNRKR